MAVLRSLTKIMLIIVITLVLLEVMLVVIDPMGMSFFSRIRAVQTYLGTGNGSYTLSPGTYDFGKWQVTMDETETRHTPAATGDCRVLFVGDSVAWGLGVNDDAVFANLLARDLGIQSINAAVFGYNTENVLASLAYRDDYDLGVYLISSNDQDEAWQINRPLQPAGDHTIPGFGLLNDGIPAIVWYALYLTYHPQGLDRPLLMERFLHDLEQIAAYDHLLIFGFDDPLTAAANQQADVHVLDWYTQQVSYVDPHPNTVGHQEIADAMRPFIVSALQETCEGHFTEAAATGT